VDNLWSPESEANEAFWEQTEVFLLQYSSQLREQEQELVREMVRDGYWLQDVSKAIAFSSLVLREEIEIYCKKFHPSLRTSVCKVK
jgi:hypothetical protein